MERITAVGNLIKDGLKTHCVSLFSSRLSERAWEMATLDFARAGGTKKVPPPDTQFTYI
jgi:hypothetical protein